MEFKSNQLKKWTDTFLSCLFCYRWFSIESKLLNHLSAHAHEKPYFCNECPKEYSSSGNLERHCRKHNKNNRKCHKCSKQFQSVQLLNAHLASHSNKNRVRYLRCNLCTRGFFFEYCLTRHIMLFHKAPETFKCELCHAAFQNKQSFEDHVRRHTGEKPFKCRFCDKTFVDRTNMSRHVVLMHGYTPRLPCEVCGKLLKNRRTLLLHFKTAHEKKVLQKCPMCPKQLRCLRSHLKRHSCEKPFQCEICRKRFTLKNMLVRHMKSHSGAGITRKYACNICQKTYTQQWGLKFHLRSQKNEKDQVCIFCGKTFIQPVQLASHVTSHTKEKQWVCHQCGHEFAGSTGLKQHKRIRCSFKEKS